MNKAIALCSSMQFKKEIKETATTLQKNGWTVFTPELSEKSTDYMALPLAEQQAAKRVFIKNHFERINQSDSILVLNYEKKGIAGYIGSNTLMEIAVAFHLGKTIYVLNSLAEQGCKEEVTVVTTQFLEGSLELLDRK